MELKRVNEYKSPEYPTVEESKNKILMMLVRSGKISLGVAVMCLLCNCSWANQFTPINRIDGGIPVEEIDSINSGIIYGLVRTVFLFGIIVVFLVTMFFTIKSFKQYKKCEDIIEKERLRNIRNKRLLKDGIVIVIFILLIMFLNIIETAVRSNFM